MFFDPFEFETLTGSTCPAPRPELANAGADQDQDGEVNRRQQENVILHFPHLHAAPALTRSGTDWQGSMRANAYGSLESTDVALLVHAVHSSF